MRVLPSAKAVLHRTALIALLSARPLPQRNAVGVFKTLYVA